MSGQYVVTFIGDDRTGIVSEMATAIERRGGNWLESQLSQLGGKFAGLILISLPDGEAADLQNDLANLPGGHWSVRVTPGNTADAAPEPNLSLEVVGPDRAGIIREVSLALAGYGISVITLESVVESAAFTGELLFKASIAAHAPESDTRAELEVKLDDIAERMTLDIDIS